MRHVLVATTTDVTLSEKENSTSHYIQPSNRQHTQQHWRLCVCAYHTRSVAGILYLMDPGMLLAQAVNTPGVGEVILNTLKVLGWFYASSIYWAPVVLPVIFWRVWMRYVRAEYIANQEYQLLEIRLPQEVMKSPAAMQAVLDGLWLKGGETTFIDRIWLGKVRIWYSLELVAFEGDVRLYIWTRKAFVRMAERSFYAHYPDAELAPVEDYAIRFPFSLDSHNLFGADYQIAGPTGLPIKTYSDYGLDSTSAKEEQKIDPMTHLLEFLGSMGRGEHLWIQMLVRANKAEDFTFGERYNRGDYKSQARAAMQKVRDNPEDTVVFPDGGTGKQLSEEQKNILRAIERNVQSSQAWDIGVRALYIAEHEAFDGTNIPGLMSMWQPFSASGFNKFVPVNRWQPVFDYPWQDFNGIRENRMKVRIFDAYRRRSWFHAPYKFRSSIITSAELATIFHVPGTVAKTPTMRRIESTRATAPSNLPT